jgi:hypothetical protein
MWLVVAQQQRANSVARSLRIRPTDDYELRPIEALAFYPNAAIARQITPVGSLRDDAFETEFTSGATEDLAVAASVRPRT